MRRPTAPPALLVALVLALAPAGRPAIADPGGSPQPVPRFVEETLSAIARLRPANRSTGGCTAVLIAPDAALTAGHCARGATEGPGAMQLVFRPARPSDSVRITVRSVTFHARAEAGRPTGTNAFADLAFLRLARPVPADVARPIPVATAARDKSDRPATGSVWGYVNGPDDLLRGHETCRLNRIGPGLLGSDCTVLGGQSGAPVLSGGDGDWRVEGIAVARVGAMTEAGPIRALIADLVPWPDFGRAGPAAPPSAAPETSP